MSKLEVDAASTGFDWCRLWDALGAVRQVEGEAESRDGFAEEGSVWRVQLRRAVPAEDGAGRIVTVPEGRWGVERKMGACGRMRCNLSTSQVQKAPRMEVVFSRI